jgi:hypothetical protein
MTDNWLTTAAAAALLNVDQSRIRQMADKQLTAKKFGHVWMLSRQSVEAWRESHEGQEKRGRKTMATKAAEYADWSAILRYDDGSLFGSLTDSDDEMQGVDREASAKRLGEDIKAAVEAQYPGMQVLVEYGPYASKPVEAVSATVDFQGWAEAEMESDILGVTAEVFERGSWIV